MNFRHHVKFCCAVFFYNLLEHVSVLQNLREVQLVFSLPSQTLPSQPRLRKFSQT